MDDLETEYELLGWPESLVALCGRLDKTGLPAAVQERLVATARPALMLEEISTPEDEIPLGATKIGGRPDVPAGFDWPIRPPYADAREQADDVLLTAGTMLALAGIAPPWLTPAKGRKFVEKVVRERDKMARDFDRMRKESLQELAELESDDSVSEEDRQGYRDWIERETFDLGPLPTEDEVEMAGRVALVTADALTNDLPLSFIAQFDFAALSSLPGFDPALPKTGRLYLFYDLLSMPNPGDPASRPGFHAAYAEADSADLVRMDLPPALAEIEVAGNDMVLQSAKVNARSVLTTVTMEASDDVGIHLKTSQMSDYDEWLLGEVGWPGQPGRDRHQLGGWPRAIQTNMQALSQLAANGFDVATVGNWQSKKTKALLAGSDKWHLLFQLGPDDAEDAVMPGAVNFLIRDEDLAELRFDRIWAVYEDS